MQKFLLDMAHADDRVHVERMPRRPAEVGMAAD
jgi:hypothetical protein